MRDFLTMKETLLVGFGRRFFNGFAQISSALGVSGEKLDEFEALLGEYEDSVNEAQAARVHLRSLTLKKNGLRARLKKLIRQLARRARTDANVTNEQLARMGLKALDNVRTPLAAPDSEPYIMVEIKRSRVHVITILDAQDSMMRTKPEGVAGAEIWFFIGDAEFFDEKNYRYIGTATRRRFSHTHEVEDIGKEVHYVVRWVNRRGARGGWSNNTSAIIAK